MVGNTEGDDLAEDLPPGEVADALSKGSRLSVYLEPDTGFDGFAVPRRPYMESYSLPHVCVEDELVVGATRRTHLMHKLGNTGFQYSAFFYTNVLPVYGLYAYPSEVEAIKTDSMAGKILNAAQYKVLRFKLNPAGDLVWSDRHPTDLSAVTNAISSGRSLYIVFSDADGICRSHPLDLAFVFPESDMVEFRIEHMLLPEVFRSPRSFRAKMHRSVRDLNTALANPGMALSTKFRIYSAFRCIDQSGAGYAMGDIAADRRHECHDVRVYALP